MFNCVLNNRTEEIKSVTRVWAGSEGNRSNKILRSSKEMRLQTTLQMRTKSVFMLAA